MDVYYLINNDLESDYYFRYNKFTYEMYALCKKYGSVVCFLDRRYDYDTQLDCNTEEELFSSFIYTVDLFVAIIYDDSSYPNNFVRFGLNTRIRPSNMLILLNETPEEQAKPISPNSLKHKLYFEELLYPQSFWYIDEAIFWIALHIKIRLTISSKIIKVENGQIYFEDAHIGCVEYIPAIKASREYHDVKESGGDVSRVAVDIIKAVEYVTKLKNRRYHKVFRPLIDSQLRGDNIGVSLLLNHDELCKEATMCLTEYESLNGPASTGAYWGKEEKMRNLSERMNIIIDKMELEALNSIIVNYNDENRDDYAAQYRKDRKMFHLKAMALKMLD